MSKVNLRDTVPSEFLAWHVYTPPLEGCKFLIVSIAFPADPDEDDPIEPTPGLEISMSFLYHTISGSGLPNASHESLKLSPEFLR